MLSSYTSKQFIQNKTKNRNKNKGSDGTDYIFFATTYGMFQLILMT